MLHIAPNFLYKYKSVRQSVDLARLIEIVCTHEIFAPTPDMLNDPMEGKGVLPYSRHGGVAGNSIPSAIEQLPRRLNTEINRCRILSLSETPTSPPMWAYYGDNYAGACLQFQFLPFEVEPMRYAPKSYAIDGVKLDSKDGKVFTHARLLTKHSDWSHELEWRAIFDSKDCNQSVFVGKHNPCAVIIGHKCRERAARKIEAACNDCGIPVYQTYLADRDYRIRIVPFRFEPELSGEPLYDQLRKECSIRNIPMPYEW